MGMCAEKTASDFQLSREIQDAYAISSYERTLAAVASGKFADDIVPVKINDKETVRKKQEMDRQADKQIISNWVTSPSLFA